MIGRAIQKIKAGIRFIVPRFYFLESGTLIMWLGYEFYF